MIDVKGKRVFMSGPMTGYAYNIDAFVTAHEYLTKMGAKHVFDPAFEWYATLQAGMDTNDHDYYMRKTLAELATSDGNGESFYDLVVMLDGWEYSKGARCERDVALALGIEVVEFMKLVGE